MPNLFALNTPADGRRPAARAGTSHAAKAGGTLHIERRQLSACAAIEAEWAALAARAIEPNPFYEPGFALPAAQHLVSFRNVGVLLVRQGRSGGTGRLLGFIPLQPSRRLFGSDVLTGWNDARLGSAAPLIDRDELVPVVEAVLGMRGSWGSTTSSGLLLQGIDRDGDLAQAILRQAPAMGWGASLGAGTTPPAPPAEGGPDLSALRHGLSRHGELALVDSASRQELRDVVEMLLALEASGPRARAGAATLQDIRETAFLRAMTRNLARSRQCRASLLTLDGQPIAGAILLGRGKRRWLYASAQDERFASFAPLAQLLAQLRRRSHLHELFGEIAGQHAVTERLALAEMRLRPGARGSLAPERPGALSWARRAAAAG
ncbi:MAG: GNAT family N-acetyltransferase [Bosea sp.]|nr:GNAT family N-acetyltransferase [Bosea sp. (in: a-proteobacteria)]